MTPTNDSATERSIVCPQCQTPTTLANTRCPKCGVNLVLAIAREARAALTPSTTGVALPYEADRFLPRFGEFLLRQGDITQTQLDAALARQKSGSGQNRTLGQILLEMGAVNREQLDRASLAQMKETQSLLKDTQAQLAVQGKRLKQMESALGDMAQLNASTMDVIETSAQRLQDASANLRSSDMALELGTTLAELDSVAAALGRYISRER